MEDPVDDYSPLLRAAVRGDITALRVCLSPEDDADADAVDIDAKTEDTDCRSALWLSASQGHLSCVQTLLEMNASVDMADTHGCTPLWIACRNGREEVTRLLLTANADPHSIHRDQGDKTIHAACWDGHLQCLRLLLDAGVDVDSDNINEWTPLYMCAQHGFADCTRLLLQRRADVNQADRWGSTPLAVASLNGHTDCVALLRPFSSTTVTEMPSKAKSKERAPSLPRRFGI